MGIGRKKLFLENFLVYGIGNVMNMIIPFIMLPIISRLLPSSDYYGINDSVSIFISIGSAIAMLGMYDSMYRFFFDNDDIKYKKQVCSSTLFFVVVNCLIAFTIILSFHKPLAEILFSNIKLSQLVIIAGINIFFSSINQILSAPTRMQNRKKTYILIQTASPIISYSFAIFFIINKEYIYALPIAALLANIINCFIYAIINRNYFNMKNFSFNILKPMLKFGLPLMPIFIFYWVLSSVGRIVIINTWGLEYAGIYAATNKIASISQLIYSAFSGGWQYFSFSTMKDQDYVELISKVFDYLAGISFFFTAILILAIEPIFAIMLPIEYSEGIIIAPMLFFAPLILMLRQTIGMHFQVKKASGLGVLTIGFGAGIAIILYLFLIPVWGLKGAAISSMTGYLCSLLLTIILLKKMKLLLIAKRFYLGFVLTIVLLLVHMNFHNKIFVYFFAILESMLLVLFYRNEIIKGINIFNKYINNLKRSN